MLASTTSSYWHSNAMLPGTPSTSEGSSKPSLVALRRAITKSHRGEDLELRDTILCFNAFYDRAKSLLGPDSPGFGPIRSL